MWATSSSLYSFAATLSGAGGRRWPGLVAYTTYMHNTCLLMMCMHIDKNNVQVFGDARYLLGVS